MVPAVSILVPVFNRAALLSECLDSILAQTMADIEVVVVDGRSTDATWDVCQRYADLDERVRIIREDANNGPVPGWARCLDEARGELGTFVWSDDCIRPTFVESTVARFSSDVGFVFTSAVIGAIPWSGRTSYRHPPGRFPADVFVRRSLRADPRLPVSPACALFRVADLRANLTFEIPTTPPVDLRSTGAGTDLLFYLRTAVRYPAVAAVDEPLAFFRSHPGSLTVQGRGGLVHQGYAAARTWFARENNHAELEAEITARYWLLRAMGGSSLSLKSAIAACRSTATPRAVLTAAPRAMLMDFAARGIARARSLLSR